eukprot:10294390-Alexandrium_andersonii.AAC.1
MVPQSSAYAQFQEEGRVMSFLLELMAPYPVRFVSFYGFSRAEADDEAMSRNQAFFASIIEEVQSAPEVPFILCGDMNCLPSSVQCISEQLQQGTLHDIAAMQCCTGQSQPLRTCTAHNARESTRRDFVLVPSSLLAAVKSVRLRPEAGYDVHTPIVVELHAQASVPFRALAQPQEFVCPDGITKKQWREKLESEAAVQFERAESSMQQAIERADTTAYWQAWSDTLVRTFRQVATAHQQHRDDDRRAKQGVPTVITKELAESWNIPRLAQQDGQVQLLALQASRELKQANRV